MEDEEAPPGVEVPANESERPSTALHAVELGAGAEAESGQGEGTAPPPPPPPKKEPTVIHVPLKVPEGARKKQVGAVSTFELPEYLAGYLHSFRHCSGSQKSHLMLPYSSRTEAKLTCVHYSHVQNGHHRLSDHLQATSLPKDPA